MFEKFKSLFKRNKKDGLETMPNTKNRGETLTKIKDVLRNINPIGACLILGLALIALSAFMLNIVLGTFILGLSFVVCSILAYKIQ